MFSMEMVLMFLNQKVTLDPETVQYSVEGQRASIWQGGGRTAGEAFTPEFIDFYKPAFLKVLHR